MPILVSVTVALRDKEALWGLSHVVAAINEFIGVDYLGVIKRMILGWCEWSLANGHMNASRRQQLFECLPYLAKYDAIDTRVLDACFREMDWKRVDFKLLDRIGSAGNPNLIEWLLNHLSVPQRLIVDIGARNGREFHALSVLHPDGLPHRMLISFRLNLFTRIDPKYHVRCAATVIGPKTELTEESMEIEWAILWTTVLMSMDYFIAKFEASPSKYVLTSFSADHACVIGHLPLLRWLYSLGVECTQSGIDVAAKAGHVDVMKWLYDRGGRPTHYAIEYAAAEGELEAAEWLFDSGLVDKSAFLTAREYAADREQDEILALMEGNKALVLGLRNTRTRRA